MLDDWTVGRLVSSRVTTGALPSECAEVGRSARRPGTAVRPVSALSVIPDGGGSSEVMGADNPGRGTAGKGILV